MTEQSCRPISWLNFTEMEMDWIRKNIKHHILQKGVPCHLATKHMKSSFSPNIQQTARRCPGMVFRINWLARITGVFQPLNKNEVDLA